MLKVWWFLKMQGVNSKKSKVECTFGRFFKVNA